jgi:hypothetical protein
VFASLSLVIEPVSIPAIIAPLEIKPDSILVSAIYSSLVSL